MDAQYFLQKAKDEYAKRYGFKSWIDWMEKRTLPPGEQIYNDIAIIAIHLSHGVQK